MVFESIWKIADGGEVVTDDSKSPTVVQSAKEIRFAVHDVLIGGERLPTQKLYLQAAEVLNRKIESCSDYHSSVCSRLTYQPLLAAVYTAYSLHYPLKISPDAVWLTIAQGIAHHMAIHGESLRDRFVAHTGKIKLTCEVKGWVEASPENPWGEAVESWTDQIKEHVGAAIHGALRCDFTTTDQASRIASLIVMMDIFETYFKYELVGICGIPRITLTGTPEDWDRMVAKVRLLRCFEIDWWLDKLLPLVEEMARARTGVIDLVHWQNICKLTDAYGGSEINGWIAYFFPYLREQAQGPCKMRNPIFEDGSGFQTFSAPSGLSEVPFTWEQDGRRRLMNAVGGLMGVRQDAMSLALEPVAGWAICEATEKDALFDRIHSLLRPRSLDIADATVRESADDVQNKVATAGNLMESYLPEDLGRFLAEFPLEMEMRLPGADESITFATLQRIRGLNWGEGQPNTRGPDGLTWFHLAELSDGRSLAMNLDVNWHSCEGYNRWRAEFSDLDNKPICVFISETQGMEGKNPVIAMSFTELLQRLTLVSDAKGFYWDQSDFTSYGDAMEFTRMEPEKNELLARRKRKGKK
jgi:hypothetical protein